MKCALFFLFMWFMYVKPVEAKEYPVLHHTAENPLCEQDLSQVRLPPLIGLLVPPEGVEVRALRPGVMHVQQEVCRCIPRWRRHQPKHIVVQLHIQPNWGKVTVESTVETPWTRPQQRMMACLGKPTFTVDPMPYRSDIITPDGPREEGLGYNILVVLDDVMQKPRARRHELRSIWTVNSH